MLLFYEVVTRAMRRLWLSYPALNEKAEPLLPSAYVKEVQRVFEPDALPAQVFEDLSPVPPADQAPQDAEDMRVQAVAQALNGDQELLAALASPQIDVAHNVWHGLTVIGQRASRDAFGPYEGLLLGEAVRQHIAARYEPDRRWSASHLEQYAKCPFQFFLERMLKLAPLEELGLQTDYLSRGSRLHDVMAILHKLINDACDGPTPVSRRDAEAFEADCQQALEEVFQAGAEGHDPVGGALREIDRRLLQRWLADYYDQSQKYEETGRDFTQPLAPAHFEVSFGLERHAGDGISTSDPLELVYEGQRVLFSGRIDRIDVGRIGDTPVFNVLDYKSGKTPKSNPGAGRNPQPPDGRSLQLELYTLAAQEVLLAGAKPWEAGYWHPAARGYKGWQRFSTATSETVAPDLAWETRRQLFLAKLFELVRGVREAEFPVYSLDDKCTSTCAFSTVCRVNQVRSLEKRPDSPAAEAAGEPTSKDR